MPWANGMRLLAKHPMKKFGSFSNYQGIGNYDQGPYLESSLKPRYSAALPRQKPLQFRESRLGSTP
jgi:hypothetical protein